MSIPRTLPALPSHSIDTLEAISTELSSSFDTPSTSPTNGNGGGSDSTSSSRPQLQTGAALVVVHPICSSNPAKICGAKVGDDKICLKSHNSFKT